MLQQEQLAGIALFMGGTFVLTYSQVFSYDAVRFGLWATLWTVAFCVLILLYVMVYGGSD
jgi:ABC-type multidrug transport system permease subunit